MNAEKIMKILEDTAYIRTGGSEEELRCAEYITELLENMGLKGDILPFEVPMADLFEGRFLADGVDVPCKGYLCAGTGEVEAPFYYLRGKDEYSLSQCKGKIVLLDSYLGYWPYQDMLKYGAVGCITYNGNVNFADRDIDQRELRNYVHNGKRMPCVNINAKDAVDLIERGVSRAKISLKQDEYTGTSHNVFLELPGEIPEYITFTAHYDSTSLSQGAYDNMSGSIGLLALAEHFSENPHRYGLRFLWCGSEERGLLGSKDYCSREENVKDCVLAASWVNSSPVSRQRRSCAIIFPIWGQSWDSVWKCPRMFTPAIPRPLRIKEYRRYPLHGLPPTTQQATITAMIPWRL